MAVDQVKFDLVVIGAGPAGLSAAITAASYGAKVAVIDENPLPGGKLLGQLHEEPGKGWWIGRQIAEQLVCNAVSCGVTILQRSEVWGLYPGWVVKINNNTDIEAPFVLLATGAAERGLPIPGWTLPGVIAIGAAQVMTNVHRVRPGNRILIVGVDALSLTVARELTLAGAEVVGITLPPPNQFSKSKSNPRSQMETLSKLASLAPSPFLRFAGKLVNRFDTSNIGARLYPTKGVRVWGVPLLLKKAVLKINGKNQVASASIASITHNGEVIKSSEKEIAVDCVCLSGGLYPLVELAAAAGCQFVTIPELGGNVPLHGPHLETSVEGLYVAGNITGIEGAKVAMAQGELAGTAIAVRLKLLDSRQPSLAKAIQYVNEVRRSSAFQFHTDIDIGRKKMEELWLSSTSSKEVH